MVFFSRKNWKKSFSGPYTWIYSAINIQNEQYWSKKVIWMWKSTLVCHTILQIEKTIAFELIVSLCIELCFSFVTYISSTGTTWKVSKYRVFSGLHFPIFGLNTEKYRPEKTPYLDAFHTAWSVTVNLKNVLILYAK